MAKRAGKALESVFTLRSQGRTPPPHTAPLREDIAYRLRFNFFQTVLPEHGELS